MKKIFLSLILVMGFSTAGAVVEDYDNTARTIDSETRTGRSSAGIFFEPMLVYSKSDTSIKTSQLPLVTDDTSGTLNDAAFGLRLGGHVSEIFILAADARYGKSRFQDSFYEAADATSYNYGLTGGVQTPIAGLQLFGTYIAGGVFDPVAGVQNVDMKFGDARGYRVGAGIHVLAVSLNLEYQELTYHQSTIESFGSLDTNVTTSVAASQAGYALSLGFPIEF